jgi:hypothetical protein
LDELEAEEEVMPLIKPRVRRVTYVRHAYRLASSVRDLLVQYAHFIDESPDYVLNAVIEATLAKDRDFLAWQATTQAEAGALRGRATAEARSRDESTDR